MVGYTHHICGSNATPTAHAQFSSKLIQLQMASFSFVLHYCQSIFWPFSS
uniref:Uncharacterized protein n=1 Tax=Amphimedon queenslandica TaxID=400682 RepID=A0A1X7T2I5_AMPQE